MANKLLLGMLEEEITLPPTCSQLEAKNNPPRINIDVPKPGKVFKGTEYVMDYRSSDEEDDEISEMRRSYSNLSELDSVSDFSGYPDFQDLAGDIYSNYTFERSIPMNLPIGKHKDEIMEMIDRNQVCLIVGETGCGKSTQVPQFILDTHVAKRQWCSIVVTQTRRLAATSLARRVCQERDWRLGSAVGYQVGLELKSDDTTRILYCTTGVLLQKLINKKNISEYSHIIVDEVHERDQDIDFTLLILKKLLRSQSNTKVIIMSATADAEHIAKYFGTKTAQNVIEPAPILHLNVKRNFPVQKFYLDDLDKICHVPFNQTLEEPEFSKETCTVVCNLLEVFDRIDQQESRDSKSSVKGSVLIFLPGIHEIEELDKLLMQHCRENKQIKYFWNIKVLHSSIRAEEQEDVFKSVVSSQRKIILSTNIAESSVTVPDVKYVIDFCLSKELNYDRNSNHTCLKLVWCSKSNCKQRRGRVGRVMPGRVYRLVPKAFYKEFEDYSCPEMLRSPLDKLILNAKLLNMGEPKRIFASAIDAPDLSDIEQNVLKLKELGALLLLSDGKYNACDGDLTQLGSVIASLPVDVHCGKLIFLGSIFGVLSEAVIIAACLTVRNLFKAPYKQHLQLYNVKVSAAMSSASDCLAFLNIYQMWRNYSGSTDRFLKKKDEAEWTRRYFIQHKTLREVHKLHGEILRRLKYSGIEEPYDLRVSGYDISADTPILLKIIIAGAFYPHYFVYGSTHECDEREAVKLLDGHDPYSTAYLRGFPTEQPGKLYTEFIREYFANVSDEVEINFSENGNKVFVTCKCPSNADERRPNDSSAPVVISKISPALYRVVKLRQLNNNEIRIPMLPEYKAKQKMKEIEEKKKKNKEITKNFENTFALPYPWCKTSNRVLMTRIIITFCENPGRFWAQIADEIGQKLIDQIQRGINDECNLVKLGDCKVGKICVAQYSEDSHYYRCRIMSCKNSYVSVYFVDYGNTENVTRNTLRDFGPDLLKKRFNQIPDLAVECTLSEIRPKIDCNNIEGSWSKNSILYFADYTNTGIIAKIYSVVNDVASVSLFIMAEDGSPAYSLNDYLLRNNYAVPAEESYLSQLDHTKFYQNSDDYTNEDFKENAYRLLSRSTIRDDYIEPPDRKECNITTVLKGPFSPLETHLQSASFSAFSSTIQIDRESVNSVLLSSYVEEDYERLVVAEYVRITEHSQRLLLRNTTKMLELRGFYALMYLLFAPTVELRTDIKYTRYTGALCGLGYDEKTRKSYFPENDAEITFDCKFTLDDVQTVNRIRAHLNMAMAGTKYNEEFSGFRDYIAVIGYIKDLIKIYDKEERVSFRGPYKWGVVPEKLLFPPSLMKVNIASENNIYKLIWAPKLKKRRLPTRAEVENSLNQYRIIAEGHRAMAEDITCILCYTTLTNTQSVQLHINTKNHEDKVNEYFTAN